MKTDYSKLIVAFIMLTISSINANAQRWCASDSIWNMQTQLHPDILMKAEQLEKFTQNYISSYETQRSKRPLGTMIQLLISFL